MYRIAICDDDEIFLNQLNRKTADILTDTGLIQEKDFHIDTFYDAVSLQHTVTEHPDRYQLLLLDIEISRENGMELARTMRGHQVTSSIIYISAYRDYVFDCFDTQPLWYLLKPVDYDRFQDILLSDYRRNYTGTRLAIRIDGRQVSIPFMDIYALESTQHHTRIWLEGSRHRDWNGALSALKPQLPAFSFCQSHNSYILNLGHVRELQRTDALMDDGRTFPISRRYYEQTFDRYLAFLKI